MENQNLMEVRKQKGLTQRDVALALDVTVTTVANWERGAHKPRLTLEQTAKLCDILGMSVHELAALTSTRTKSGTDD